MTAFFSEKVIITLLRYCEVKLLKYQMIVNSNSIFIRQFLNRILRWIVYSNFLLFIVLSLVLQRKYQRKETTGHNFGLNLRPLHKPSPVGLSRHDLNQSSRAPWTALARRLSCFLRVFL